MTREDDCVLLQPHEVDGSWQRVDGSNLTKVAVLPENWTWQTDRMGSRDRVMMIVCGVSVRSAGR